MAKKNQVELSIKILGKVDRSLTNAISNATSQVSGLSRTMSHIGTAGLAAMAALSTGTVAALVDCTKAAQNFEKNMSDVVKYVDGLADANGKIIPDKYKEMEKALLDLSTQIPMTAEDLTRLAAAAGQSGYNMSDLIEYDSNGNIAGFLKDVAMTATAMDISADLAGDMAAKWEKSLNMTHDEVMVLFDQINYLGANSATTAAEIADVVNNVASLGQIAGYDAASTAAIADAMLAMGVESSVASTSLSRMMVNMSKGEGATKAQKAAWEELGFTAQGVASAMQEVDAAGNPRAPQVMMDVLSAIGNMDADRQVATLNTLFGQWAIKGAAKLTGNLQTYVDALDMVNNPNLYTGSMEREFTIKANTTEAVDMMRKNAIEALKIDVGDAFLPVKKEFATTITELANYLRENMPEIKELAEKLATLLSIGAEKMGDGLDKALPTIEKVFDYLINNGDQVAGALGGIAAAFAAMKFAPAAEGAFGMISTLLGGKAGTQTSKPGGLFGLASSMFTGGQKGAKNAWTNIGNTWNGLNIGAGLGNQGSSFGNYGLSGTKAEEGGFFKRIENGVLGAIFGSKNKIGLSSTDDKTMLDAIFRTTDQINAAKDNGGLAGLAKTAISNSKAGQYVGGIGKGAGSMFGSMKGLGGSLMGIMTGTSPAAGAMKGQMGGVLSGAASMVGGAWAPVMSGFGSLLAGVGPIVAAIGGVIAVVSILYDNLDGVREIVGNIFGEEGLQVFDQFKGGLDSVIATVQDLFNGGLASALSGVRDNFANMLGGGGFLTTLLGGEDTGLAAFDGAVSILQSILGVVGQIVDFGVNYVKPIIQEIFSFVTTTVLPAIVNMFATAAPTISSIISNVGSAVMSCMQMVMMAIQAALPIIEGIIKFVMDIGSVILPAVLGGLDAFAQGLSTVFEGAKTFFGGIIDFVTGVFTGNWSQAWEGVKNIFSGAFEALVGLCKTPINAVIGIINGAIRGINSIGITIPDWVPGLGGKSFAVNIPEIPALAKGGFTDGPSIAGEAGREAVISFANGVRSSNINTWMQAGRMLGVNGQQAAMAAGGFGGQELKEIDSSSGGQIGNVTFAPQITIQGNADQGVVDYMMDSMKQQFDMWWEQMNRQQARTAY